MLKRAKIFLKLVLSKRCDAGIEHSCCWKWNSIGTKFDN
jgi:hypothetical protein